MHPPATSTMLSIKRFLYLSPKDPAKPKKAYCRYPGCGELFEPIDKLDEFCSRECLQDYNYTPPAPWYGDPLPPEPGYIQQSWQRLQRHRKESKPPQPEPQTVPPQPKIGWPVPLAKPPPPEWYAQLGPQNVGSSQQHRHDARRRAGHKQSHSHAGVLDLQSSKHGPPKQVPLRSPPPPNLQPRPREPDLVPLKEFPLKSHPPLGPQPCRKEPAKLFRIKQFSLNCPPPLNPQPCCCHHHTCQPVKPQAVPKKQLSFGPPLPNPPPPPPPHRGMGSERVHQLPRQPSGPFRNRPLPPAPAPPLPAPQPFPQQNHPHPRSSGTLNSSAARPQPGQGLSHPSLTPAKRLRPRAHAPRAPRPRSNSFGGFQFPVPPPLPPK
ncbi:hypothetical protein C8Q79DRAFT_924892 [Trametes meyenii]|nr:hypothetical protein C8Q79DRAFT_924892 [Trametes meyenii]